MESVVSWRTGTPDKDGEYLVTRYSPLGKGRTYTQTDYYCCGRWLMKVLDASYVTAWCHISEIEPYREDKNE